MSVRPNQLLSAWVHAVVAHANKVFAVAVLLTFAAAGLAYTRLSVDTDPANMLSAELPWRKAEKALEQAFPAADPGLIVVIEGPNGTQTADAQRELLTTLSPQKALFSNARATELEPYFRKNGLLYLETEAVDEFAVSMLAAQPFLGALAKDLSLSGVANLLSNALQAPPGISLAAPLNAFADAANAAADGQAAPLDWPKVMGTTPSLMQGTRRIVELWPVLDYQRLQPATAPMRAVRQAIADLGNKGYSNITMRITGSKALEHEEIGQAFSGALLAFSVALVLSFILLLLALRDWRLVRAAVLTLIFGLVQTAAFAALAVPRLNLISMAFAVLYVGLGLNYSLYVTLRYRELRQAGVAHLAAVPQAVLDVGGFLFACAATTSLGFLAFVPTSFTGIAGLGLISAGGMVISLLSALTVLPALMRRIPNKPVSPPVERPWLNSLLEAPYRHAKSIWWGSAVLLLVAALLAPRAYFDFDPLHLRDPKAESVATFRSLLRDPNLPVLTLSALANTDAEARALQARLMAVPEVARVVSPMDLVPQDQQEKLAMLQELKFSMGPVLGSGGSLQVLSLPSDAAALDKLQDAMSQAQRQWKGADSKAAKRLSLALARLQEAPQSRQGLGLLRDNLLSGLPPLIGQLRELLAAEAVTEAQLPPWLRARWRATDGRPRLEISAKAILDDNAATAKFVDAVRKVDPSVTGGPIGMIEAGRAVVASFKQAFLYSVVAITLVCLLALRSLRDTALVLVPVGAAGLLILAMSVLTRTPFNFANVIALPLLLGVGVDYGVYLVQQARRLPPGSNLLKTAASKAVLVGALITIANFGDLMLARHPGMVSMGLLLAVGLAVILLCNLVLLPSLLARLPRPKGG